MEFDLNALSSCPGQVDFASGQVTGKTFLNSFAENTAHKEMHISSEQTWCFNFKAKMFRK